MCPDCGKGFATYHGMKCYQSVENHNRVKSFSCEVCHMTYTRLSSPYRHKRRHADDSRRQIRCTDCNHGFSTNISLAKHRWFCQKALNADASTAYLGTYAGTGTMLPQTPQFMSQIDARPVEEPLDLNTRSKTAFSS
jgi:hypothetical protein